MQIFEYHLTILFCCLWFNAFCAVQNVDGKTTTKSVDEMAESSGNIVYGGRSKDIDWLYILTTFHYQMCYVSHVGDGVIEFKNTRVVRYEFLNCFLL